MKQIDCLRLAMGNLKRTKFRSFLTILGVVIGISSIVLLVSLGVGLEKITTSQLANMDTLLTITVTQKEETATMEKGKPINEATMEQIKKIKGVKEVSAIISQTGTSEVLNTSSETIIIGIDPGSLKVELTGLEKGKEFNQGNEAIITKSLVESIGKTEDEIINQDIKIKLINLSQSEESLTEGPATIEAKIVGIDKAKNGNMVYLPLSILKEKLSLKDYSSLKVRAEDQKSIDKLVEEIKNLGFETATVKELLDQVNKVFLLVQLVLGFFGAIGLLVASLGIINTMAISLIERIREIGIMKAIGASDSDVFRLFIYESALIGFIGGIIGILIAIGIGMLFNAGLAILMVRANQTPVAIFIFSWEFSAIMVLFSVFISSFAGIYPALRGRKMAPLQALFQR